MAPEDFEQFRHRAVHALQHLNSDCEEQFRIGQWERWDYDLDSGTLVFSESGAPKVIAQIQAVGTTSKTSGTWLWGWANESLPPRVTARLRAVRDFGEAEGLHTLTEPKLPDDEYLGWELTAITAQIIDAKGAYRCPGENGFFYLVYTDLKLADPGDGPPGSEDAEPIECGTHGSGQKTYVCEHLVREPGQEWFSDSSSPSNPWPDAWCAQCDQIYQGQGEWNDNNSGELKIKLLCHRCYESLRAQATTAP